MRDRPRACWKVNLQVAVAASSFGTVQASGHTCGLADMPSVR
jgi:hypothetical protein